MGFGQRWMGGWWGSHLSRRLVYIFERLGLMMTLFVVCAFLIRAGSLLYSANKIGPKSGCQIFDGNDPLGAIQKPDQKR